MPRQSSLRHVDARDNYRVHKQKRTTCNKSANKLLQVCSQAVNKMSSHCLFPVVETSLWQLVEQLVTSLLTLSDLLQGCYNKLVTAMMLTTC